MGTKLRSGRVIYTKSDLFWGWPIVLWKAHFLLGECGMLFKLETRLSVFSPYSE